MRQWVKLLIGITIIYMSGTSISATSLITSISGSNTVEVGGEITLTFYLDIEEPVKLMTAELIFDSDLLEIVGIPVALNGLDVTVDQNNIIIVNALGGSSGSVSFMRMTFKAKEALTKDSTASISLNNVSGIMYESNESVSGSGSSKLITAISPKSDNNYLSNLFTNAGSIGFTRNTFEYSLVVEHDATRIRIVAKAEDDKATVKEDAMYDLSVYRNVINIDVLAENGAKRTYTINVIRKDALGHTSLKSSSSELKSLAVEGYQIEFTPLISEYRLTVSNIVDNVLIYAEAADPKSSLIISNLPLLKLGENRVQVTVVAENGQSRIYTVFVTRSLETPIVKLQDLGEIVYLTTATTIPVIIEDYYLLSGEVLGKVRKATKILDIQKSDAKGHLLYRWTIDGRSVKTDTSIDFNIRLDSTHSDIIGELLDSSDFRIIGFSHQGEFPMDTIVRVYIGNMFPHMSTLNLYRYDNENQSLELYSQLLRVDNGYVEFEVLLAGEYVVSDVEIIQKHPMDIVLYLVLGIIFSIIMILISLLFRRHINHSKMFRNSQT